MIPYMFGKLAPSSTYSTGGLVKYIPGRSYFRAVFSQNGDKIVTPLPPPQSLNGSGGRSGENKTKQNYLKTSNHKASRVGVHCNIKIELDYYYLLLPYGNGQRERIVISC